MSDELEIEKKEFENQFRKFLNQKNLSVLDCAISFYYANMALLRLSEMIRKAGKNPHAFEQMVSELQKEDPADYILIKSMMEFIIQFHEFQK